MEASEYDEEEDEEEDEEDEEGEDEDDKSSSDDEEEEEADDVPRLSSDAIAAASTIGGERLRTVFADVRWRRAARAGLFVATLQLINDWFDEAEEDHDEEEDEGGEDEDDDEDEGSAEEAEDGASGSGSGSGSGRGRRARREARRAAIAPLIGIALRPARAPRGAGGAAATSSAARRRARATEWRRVERQTDAVPTAAALLVDHRGRAFCFNEPHAPRDMGRADVPAIPGGIPPRASVTLV
jgi:hypothetical protein